MTVALSVLCYSNVMTVALCPDTPVLQLCHDSCSLCPVLCYSVSRQSHSLSCPVLQHVMTVALSVLCYSNVMTVALVLTLLCYSCVMTVVVFVLCCATAVSWHQTAALFVPTCATAVTWWWHVSYASLFALCYTLAMMWHVRPSHSLSCVTAMKRWRVLLQFGLSVRHVSPSHSVSCVTAMTRWRVLLQFGLSVRHVSPSHSVSCVTAMTKWRVPLQFMVFVRHVSPPSGCPVWTVELWRVSPVWRAQLRAVRCPHLVTAASTRMGKCFR